MDLHVHIKVMITMIIILHVRQAAILELITMHLQKLILANFESFADDGWYLDNEATHHLTNNMENLHFKEDYKGTDQLIIVNGQGLSISYIGHAFLSFRASKHPYTHATTITLKDMLLVPIITKNLLSISKLTSDNSLSVEFCGNVCYVKCCANFNILASARIYCSIN